MKIITKSNYNEELYVERVIAYKVNAYFGKQMVDEWNNKYWNDHSGDYLALVDDEHELYNGYKVVYGDY